MCDVLVLEDDGLVRDLLVEVLETAGFEVAACSTPQEALGLIDSLPPCRMLATDIDLGVRGLNGFEVARRVRDVHPNFPVLYLSGQPHHLNGHRLGPCEDFLSKPFQISNLLGKLNALGVGPSGQTCA